MLACFLFIEEKRLIRNLLRVLSEIIIEMEKLERIQVKILGTPLEKNLCNKMHRGCTSLKLSSWSGRTHSSVLEAAGRKPGPLPAASQHLKGHFSLHSIPLYHIILWNELKAAMTNLYDHSSLSDHYRLNTSFLQCDVNPLVGRNTMYIICLIWMSSWTFGLS